MKAATSCLAPRLVDIPLHRYGCIAGFPISAFMSAPPSSTRSFYPIGTPGQPWGPAELAAWRARQTKQRSYADEVMAPLRTLSADWEVLNYGAADHGEEHFPLMALRSRHWRDDAPVLVVTGGVHGYETSGVHGALALAARHAKAYADRANLLIAPCVSPWAYERIHRWNAVAIDPNRNFRPGSAAPECAALVNLLAPLGDRVLMHIDLHETTDTDESEFRPALAARDGKPFEPCAIPDGFYLVADSENPQLAFQQAIIQAVAPVTHIAPADDKGHILDAPELAPGIIAYPVRTLGLCAGLTRAPYTTTTEVYPDSPTATPAQCIAAQVAAACAAMDYALAHTVR